MGKSQERRESVIEKRRETTDRCGKKVEGSESVFKKGRELEKYIFIFNAEGNPGTEKKGEGMESVFNLLCSSIIAYYTRTPRTFSHGKIALNHTIPMVVIILNLAKRLLRYGPIFV